MEILEILNSAKESIYPEDLDFFETELATGDYPSSYIAECREKIVLIRKWFRDNEIEIAEPESDTTNLLPAREPVSKAALVMEQCDITPQNDPAEKSPTEVIFSEICVLREHNDYKSKFRKYIRESTQIDAAFIDTHYAFFQPWEMEAILTIKQLSEDFLEKYFGALDKEKIAKYQCFSESFFMKHFAQLDTALVLNKGKNEWRKKKQRSSQLDVFLRLKGVTL